MGERRFHGWALLILAWLTVWPSQSWAYPWMIEHQYTSCSQCHVDPSGGSAMTPYGRAQTEAILRTHYNKEKASEEPGKVKDFLFGAVSLPEEVIAQVDVRGLFIPRPDQFRFLLMQSDLRGGVHTKSFTAYASVGVVSEGALGARIVSNEGARNEVVTPVARDYWLGVRPTRSLTLRAGRMNLPFGIRTDEHIRYTRAVTRTTTNADQQLGVAASYEAKQWRAEVMGIAGNFQVRPDAFRERGYSGMFAWAPSNQLELGVSSLVAASQADVASLEPTTRQAHGLFGRYAPVSGLAILGEVDVLYTQTGVGAAGLIADLQADWEATKGVHLKAGGEFCDTSFSADGASGRGWGAVQWFFAPHINVRLDALYGPLTCDAASEARPMALAQLHAFL